MTHSLSSLSAVGRKSIRVGGIVRGVGGGLRMEGRLARFLARFAAFLIAVVVPLSHTLFTLFGCSRCKHKRLVTAIYQRGSLAVSALYLWPLTCWICCWLMDKSLHCWACFGAELICGADIGLFVISDSSQSCHPPPIR